MALVKEDLATAIKEAFLGNKDDPRVQEIADRLAAAIDTFVKTATVNGVCPTGGGPLTTGTLT